MKRIFYGLALAALATVAQAHPSNRVHYHQDDGSVVYSRVFRPVVETSYETDRYGRQIRVETTTTCARTRVNHRNNHLRCLAERVTERRFVERARAEIEPVVTRRIERDQYGRKIIVTTTQTCTETVHTRSGNLRCENWETRVDREYVRRGRGDRSFDLNGDGKAEAWEHVLVESFREVLDSN